MKKEKEALTCARKKTSIGGQALMEGIMMRGPKRSAMAVRNLKGEIVIEEWDTVSKKPAKIWTLPLFRGLYGMYSSMKVGYQALMRSAVLSGLDELEEQEENENRLKKLNKKRAKEGLAPLEELPEDQRAEHKPSDAFSFVKKEEPAEEKDEEQIAAEQSAESSEDAKTAENEAEKSAKEKKKADKKEKKDSSFGGLFAAAAVIGTVLGVGLCVLLFFYLPTQLYSWTIRGLVEQIEASYPQMLLRSLFEGLIRIVLFVIYMAGVSLMKDIKRTFMYHGAEHKTIFCYEKGLPLTVENVKKMTRFHPRCGTSFMVIMLILGILIGSFIPEIHLEETFVGGYLDTVNGWFDVFNNWLESLVKNTFLANRIPDLQITAELVNNLARTLCKLALLPLTVGIGYEIIKLAGKHDNWFVRLLSAPGLWMQRISTKEPTDDMIECAIESVKKVIPEDGSDRI